MEAVSSLVQGDPFAGMIVNALASMLFCLLEDKYPRVVAQGFVDDLNADVTEPLGTGTRAEANQRVLRQLQGAVDEVDRFATLTK